MKNNQGWREREIGRTTNVSGISSLFTRSPDHQIARLPGSQEDYCAAWESGACFEVCSTSLGFLIFWVASTLKTLNSE